MEKRRPLILAILLFVSIGNYYRLHGTEHITMVQFLSIFAMGALTGLLIREIGQQFRSGRQ
jgi:hypothetical protein